MTTPADDPGGAPPPIAPEPGEPIAPPPPVTPPPGQRRLVRSRSDRWLGGVGGGLADYLDIDPTLVRLGLIVLMFVTGGIAIAGYFVLWIVMPEDGGSSLASRHADGHRRRSGMGGVIWGLLLIAAGLAFLIAQLDLDLDLPPWRVMLSIILILIGLVITLESRRRVAAGLIVLALIVTAALGAGDLADFDAEFDSGFGDREIHPRSAADLDDSYSHAFGSMTVDLRDLEAGDGTTALELDIAFGSIELYLPDDIAYRIEVDGAFSSAEGIGNDSGGIGLNREYVSPDYATAGRRIDIDLSVVFGSAEVHP